LDINIVRQVKPFWLLVWPVLGVKIISGEKLKTETYGEFAELSDQIKLTKIVASPLICNLVPLTANPKARVILARRRAAVTERSRPSFWHEANTGMPALTATPNALEVSSPLGGRIVCHGASCLCFSNH
jgi:hypothetical protein